MSETDDAKMAEAQKLLDEAKAKREKDRVATAAPARSEPKPGDADFEPYKHELGGQVMLTGAARAAARGATHGEIADNTMARDGAIAAGHVAHSAMPDMDTKPPEYAVQATLGGDPAQPTVKEAEYQLQVAKEREAAMKERSDSVAMPKRDRVMTA